MLLMREKLAAAREATEGVLLVLAPILVTGLLAVVAVYVFGCSPP